MLRFEDCLALCGLTEDEVQAIAQHEHVPEIAAVEFGNYLVQTPDGELLINAMIRDDIDEGAKTYKEVCTQCHTAKVRPLDKKRLTKEQWRQAVAKMVDLGAEVPKDKIPALLDYLASTHGPAGAAGGDGKK